MKRNLGHASTSTVLNMEEIATSRQCLNNWQCLLGANILVQSRRWYDAHYSALRSTQAHYSSLEPSQFADMRDMSWELHCVRCDATNSSSYLGPWDML
eukprot:9492384-Pyramimonas_sp.AAC.1